MTFKKKGQDIIERLKGTIAHEKRARDEASQRFEREKQKRDLQEVRESEVRIGRLERILAHTVQAETYELTEQDLIDFGF